MDAKAKKTVSNRASDLIEDNEKEILFYQDIRFWLALILSGSLLYLTAASYPVLW